MARRNGPERLGLGAAAFVCRSKIVKVLVSTKKTQGQRANDFSFVEEDEIVMPSWTCSKGSVDDQCGCRRSISGIVIHKPTTTMKVVERDITTEQLVAKFEATLRESGFKDGDVRTTVILRDRKIATVAKENAGAVTEAAARFELGAVLEYRDGVFSERVVS